MGLIKKISILGLAAILILSACKTRKGRNHRLLGSHADTSKPVLSEIKNVLNNAFEFDYLSFKSKCDYKDLNMDQSFTMNLRMRYDSIVWISITAVGFEVARAKLDKDSIKILNRLEKKYAVYDYAFIKKLIGTNLSLLQIQYLLTANLLFPPSDYGPTVDNAKFRAVSGYVENTVTLDNKSKILEHFLQHLVEQTNASISYSDFKKIEKQQFPGKVNMAIKTGKGDVSLIMENSSINTAIIDAYPFEIPSKYEKVN